MFEPISTILDAQLAPAGRRPKAILAFALRHAAELEDVVQLRSVVRIGTEDLHRLRLTGREFLVAPDQVARQPLVVRRRADDEGSAHRERRRRRVAGAAWRSSARKSSAGRLLPARYSALLFRMCARMAGSCSSR